MGHSQSRIHFETNKNCNKIDKIISISPSEVNIKVNSTCKTIISPTVNKSCCCMKETMESLVSPRVQYCNSCKIDFENMLDYHQHIKVSIYSLFQS